VQRGSARRYSASTIVLNNWIIPVCRGQYHVSGRGNTMATGAFRNRGELTSRIHRLDIGNEMRLGSICMFCFQSNGLRTLSPEQRSGYTRRNPACRAGSGSLNPNRNVRPFSDFTSGRLADLGVLRRGERLVSQSFRLKENSILGNPERCSGLRARSPLD